MRKYGIDTSLIAHCTCPICFGKVVGFQKCAYCHLVSCKVCHCEKKCRDNVLDESLKKDNKELENPQLVVEKLLATPNESLSEIVYWLEIIASRLG